MGNEKKTTPAKEQGKPRAPKPATLLGYILSYMDDKGLRLDSGTADNGGALTVDEMIQSLKDDIVEDALANG